MTPGTIIQSIDGDGHTLIIIIREVVLFNTPKWRQTASQQQQSAADNERRRVVSVTYRNTFTIHSPTSIYY